MFIFVKFNKFPRHVFFSGSFNNVQYDITTSIRICCLTCIYFLWSSEELISYFICCITSSFCLNILVNLGFELWTISVSKCVKQGRWSDNWFNNIPAVFFFTVLFILHNKLSIRVPPPCVNLVGRVMCGNRLWDVRRSKKFATYFTFVYLKEI